MLTQINRKAIRRRVRYRIRRKISGTAKRPRLAVFRSQKHIYVQAIDDAAGRTMAQASTQEKEVGSNLRILRGEQHPYQGLRVSAEPDARLCRNFLWCI